MIRCTAPTVTRLPLGWWESHSFDLVVEHWYRFRRVSSVNPGRLGAWNIGLRSLLTVGVREADLSGGREDDLIGGRGATSVLVEG